MEAIRDHLEMELRVNQSMVDQLSNDNIFKAEYEEKVKVLKERIESLTEESMSLEDSIDNDIFLNNQLEEQEEEIDEDLEMWKLDQLNKDYKFGTNSWDL